MNDLPTYREFRYSNIGNVVKTTDGRFFVITNSKLFRYLFRGIIIVLIPAAAFLWVWLDRSGIDSWPNILSFDLPLLILLLQFSFARIYYRFADFAELHEDHPEYREAAELFESRKRKAKKRAANSGSESITVKTVLNVISALILAFMLLNSHTVQLVRSLFDSPRLVSAGMRHFGTVDLWDAGTSTAITIPSNTSELDVFVVVARTAETAEFALDGKPVTDDLTLGGKAVSTFWQPDYLKRRYDLGLTQIRDGSTLTLTCGSLHQEWVFDVPDEEAS